jgi:hypothetical protein
MCGLLGQVTLSRDLIVNGIHSLRERGSRSLGDGLRLQAAERVVTITISPPVAGCRLQTIEKIVPNSSLTVIVAVLLYGLMTAGPSAQAQP